MDPETRAEFEEQQKKGILGTGAGPTQANALSNFDMASWMAGRSQAEVRASTPSNQKEGGGAGGGGKEGKGKGEGVRKRA